MSRRATASCLELPPMENEEEELRNMKSHQLTRKLTDNADNPSRAVASSTEDPKSSSIGELASNQLNCRKSIFETHNRDVFSVFSINMISKTSLCGRAICRR